MDWLSLQRHYVAPPGLPARAARLLALERVLSGTQYDVLPNPFSRERSGAGEYIPLALRRPSVRTNLCRIVVDEAVSLLFGDTHWPSLVAADSRTVRGLVAFARDVGLPSLMTEGAIRGAVGSVAILFEVAHHVPRLSILNTAYLTPRWDTQTGILLEVVERYQVIGHVLAEQGHVITSDMLEAHFWWKRVWDVDSCTVFVPTPLGEEPSVPDTLRSIHHGLGFVPIVWTRNLSTTGMGEPDGECTFERAIDTVIEADYLLSQAGRGLKYGSDPTLVLKTNGFPENDVRQGGAASALTLPPEGDAKLLEINGNAAGAVLAHYRELRQLVLEQLHGNRAHGDRLSAGQSGRALEMMSQPLIWLADRLRHSYGEGGLIPIYRMACRFSSVLEDGLYLGGEMVRSMDPNGLALHWPPWFAPGEMELLSLAQGLVAAWRGGILSRETAVRLYATATGNPDPSGEWDRVCAFMADDTAENEEF
ncbi:phage portal protein [Brytella acorum]|uniref:Portal protein n=1 Tax=Brytella acorum TaxID=2959299 RepID=A0AA35XY54_9PROT|nr:portal protein [Brytella acorum]MDF3625084.1 portal protein [Brytella acorum]CAI9121037.1 portal protein [Brytella acorum]